MNKISHFFCVLILVSLFSACTKSKALPLSFETDQDGSTMAEEITPSKTQERLSIEIEYLKNLDYPGSELTIEQTLSPGNNYRRYIASYYSEGLKQYGLLTIPNGDAPESGWPAIIFNHGYIAPEEYKTTERYIAYTDYFSRNGYVLFRPDYRGHDQSEGIAQGGYGNSDYIIDVLNAFSSIKTIDNVDPENIGMWGHSMGGWITHRAMVVNPSIKAGVIWAGMVGGYDDLLELRRPYWERRGIPEPTPDPENPRRHWRSYLLQEYGKPSENPEFWARISAIPYLEDLSGPIQLHHAKGDESVNYELAERFFGHLEKVSTDSELYIYEGDDHNISANFGTAMQRSLTFFDTYLKN